MEICKRCHGGEIYAPNCPVCGGSGWVDEQAPSAVSPGGSHPVAVISPEARHRQIEERRKAREEEKKRKVRVRSIPSAKAKPRAQQYDSNLDPLPLPPAECQDRERWLKKYEKRQARRLAEEKRRKSMTFEQLAQEDAKRRERAYLRRLAKMRVVRKGDGQPKSRAKDKVAEKNRQRTKRLSREEQSARLATNNQLGAQLGELLKQPEARDVVRPSVRQDGCPPNQSTDSAATKRGHKRKEKRTQKGYKPRYPKGRMGRISSGRLGGVSKDFPGEDMPRDPMAEVNKEFTTATPTFEREEDASRYMGHSFRDHGEYGSIPMYDDYDN